MKLTLRAALRSAAVGSLFISGSTYVAGGQADSPKAPAERTADDQKMNQSDTELTRKIRKAIVADKSFSINARNVKIITRDGMVTLRGRVNSAEEKAAVERIANEHAGNAKVKNELEMKSPS